MTKILNSLLVTGTGSNNQSLGITAGYVSISDKLRVGDWSSPTAIFDVSSLGTNSTTKAVNISTSYPLFSTSLSYSDDGVLRLVGAGLGYGATNSYRISEAADLVVGNNYYGSIDLQGYGIFGKDQGTSEGLQFLLRKGGGGTGTYSRSFRFVTATDRQFNLTPESDSQFSINFPTYNNAYIRISSLNDSNKYFRITSDTPSGTQSDRFGIQSYVTYSTIFFRNTNGIQLDSIKIQSNNTFNGNTSHFIIGASGSSNTGTHSVSLTTGSIFITPFQTITLTASYGLLKNTFIGTNINTRPTTGNYNIFLGGRTSITSGLGNIVIGDYSTGDESGRAITSGSGNVAVGAISLKSVTTGGHNTALGYRSLELSTGNSNIGIGYFSGIQISGSSNIFIGNMAGYGQSSGNYITHISSNVSEAGGVADNNPRIYRLSSSNRTEYGTLPTWAANTNGSNVLMFGSEGSYYGSSNLSSPGTFRTMFFGKGAYHWSSELYTYVITTAIPAQNYFTSGGSQSFTQSNIDAVGSNLELVAGIGRGGGTAGDLYFSTGQLTASGTSSLQEKINRMTIKGGSGFVGIGPGTFSNSPTTLLHIWGTSSGIIRIQDGSQGVGKVLTSDINGVGTWQTLPTPTGGFFGDPNYIPFFDTTTTIATSNIYQGTSSGTILIGYTSSSPNYDSDTNTLRVKGNVYFDYTDFVKAKYFINGTYLFDDVLQNLALGYNSLNGNTQSTQTEGSIAIGYESQRHTTNGKFNISIGFRSLHSIINGQNNISIGYNSMVNGTGSSTNNISIGSDSLRNVSTNNNIAIGASAGVNYSATSSNSLGLNTFIGHAAARGFVEGINNIFLTNNNDNNIGITNGNGNIIIGSRITLDSQSRNGNVIIGSSITSAAPRTGLTNSVMITDGSGTEKLFINSRGDVFIGGTAALFGPSAKLVVWNSGSPTSSIRIYDGFQGTGKILVSDSQGLARWSTFSEGSNYFVTPGLTLSSESEYYINGNLRRGFTLSLVTGRGITISSNAISVSQNIISKSSDFQVQESEWGYIFNVTTGTSLITVTLPSTTAGFEFTIKKVDQTNGAVLVNGAYEFNGSVNLSYITRLGQTIKYVYNGTSWTTITLDDGVLNPNTLLANFGTTMSYADEMSIIDINDPVQETINYNQGSWDYDWMSGVVFSSYRPLSLTNPSNSSIFNTASNNYIGATGLPLAIKSFGMKLGKSYKIQLSGTYSHGANCTFSFYPRIGSVTISSITINNTSTFSNTPFYIDYTFKCLAVGSNGQVHGSGFLMSGNTYNLIMSTSSHFSTVNTTINNNIGFVTTKDAGPTLSFTVIHSTIERLA